MKPEPTATARLSAFGWWAPNQRGGDGLCTGFGSMVAWLSREELAVEGDARLCPQPLHDLDPFLEARGASLGRQAVGGIGLRVAAEADSDDEPAPGELIERGQPLRHVHGAVERRQQHGRPEPHARGHGGRIRQELDRLEGVDRPEDPVHDPGALVSEGLGSTEELADVGDRERTVE